VSVDEDVFPAAEIPLLIAQITPIVIAIIAITVNPFFFCFLPQWT
jgi:hypothetical protein